MNQNNHKEIFCPVVFNNRAFLGIEEFDCYTVRLYTEETLNGTFSTVIPISDVNYRNQHPTKASVHIKTDGDWVIFDIRDDWGKLHVMKIHESLSKEIQAAKNGAIKQGILID